MHKEDILFLAIMLISVIGFLGIFGMGVYEEHVEVMARLEHGCINKHTEGGG